MNLRLHSEKNCTLARAQAALVALLYVFLCTFGMLTHTHGSDVHAPAVSSVPAASTPVISIASAGSTPHRPTTAHAPVGKHALTTDAHCAFCDWQLNNQGRTVAPFLLPAPQTIAYSCVRFAAPGLLVFVTLASSRAPPASCRVSRHA